jgi:hypothetical protein
MRTNEVLAGVAAAHFVAVFRFVSEPFSDAISGTKCGLRSGLRSALRTPATAARYLTRAREGSLLKDSA